MRGILCTKVMFALGLSLLSASLMGQTTWTGAVSSVWDVAGNWAGGVPNSGVNAVIAAGTPNAPSTSGVANAACSALTVNAGAVLTIAAGFPLAASGDVLLNGSIAGGGVLRMAGVSATNLSGPGTIGASLEIAKLAGISVFPVSDTTVNGNLMVTTGNLAVSNNGNFVVSVSGNAQFQGGSLIGVNNGVVDVAGNVTFSGTSVTAAPIIRCGGTWVSDAAFAPTSGLVVFDGTGAQSVTSAGTFPGVTITSTSSITTSTALTMNGPLTVAGSFTDSAASLTVNGSLSVTGTMSMGSGPMDVNGDLTVGAGASLALGSATHSIAGNCTVSGSLTATGTLVFDGGVTTAELVSTAAFPSVQVSKSAGFSLIVASNVTVNGNLTVTSGNFGVSNNGNFTMAVTGNAQFQGGTLTGVNQGVIDVAGNVTFSGTSVTAAPIIRCGGNWVSNAAFAPTSGLVVFDGTGAQSVTSAGTFPGVTITSTSSITTSTALTMNGPLTVAGSFTDSAASLTVNGGLSVTGAMSMGSGPMDVNGDLTVGAGAALALGSATHSIAGNFTVSGSFTATGTLVFDGGGTAQLVSTAALPSVQISKSAGIGLNVASDVTVNGNLTVTSGGFGVSNNGNFTVSVSGNAQFQGGTLTGLNQGVIDVAGNVTFSGTSVPVIAPIIRCGANWVSNAAFVPPSGLVVFDGTGAQSVTSAGTFPGVTIASTSSITTSTALTMNGPLTVAGSFTDSAASLTVNGSLSVTGTMSMASGPIDVNGDLTVGAGATLALGSATHSIAGNCTVSGSFTATGTLVFDGGGTAQLVSTAALPSVQISKSAGIGLNVASDVTVNGNLTVTSGSFGVSNNGNFTVSVSGNAQFQGGTLTGLNQGVIDVAGNVTVSGTTASAPPIIRCAGNWVSNAAFAPTSGTVELDGVAPTTIAHAVAGGSVTLPNLVIKNGSRSLVNDFTIAASSLTIDTTGTLVVDGGRHLRVHKAGNPTVVTVNGALGVAANSELSLGGQTTVTIAPGGLLGLLGVAGQPASITGEAGGGYGLVVNGVLTARHFVVRDAGPAGMVINATATIAPAPNDLRDGTFDFRAGAPAGSVLLDVRRQAPAGNFDNLAFLNTPGASGVFNVKTVPSSLPVSFTNWTGAFGGPGFENDPNNLIAWNLQAGPTLAFFQVLPGAELAEIVWATTAQLNVTGWELRRATAALGPFAIFQTIGNTGTSYGVVDAPRLAGQAVFYALYATMSGGDVLLVGTGSTTPYSSATPGNIKKVGANGTFATIQAAINAATDPNSIVWVTPGTYASFTIGATATPTNLRILGDGTGPVNIDTSSGPIQIMNLPASTAIELSNLSIGSPTTAQDGVVITNCLCPVVLDEVDVACNGAHTAVSVSASPSTAIQRCDIQGGSGLSVINGSYVGMSRGSLGSLHSSGASTVEISTLVPGSVNVIPPASLITRAGLMPDIDLPEFVRLSFPSALFLEAQPNAAFFVAASVRFGFQTSASAFEMPFLLDASALAVLPVMSTDGLGLATIPFEVAPFEPLLGFTFTVQAVVADPGSGALRVSNVESMVCIP